MAACKTKARIFFLLTSILLASFGLVTIASPVLAASGPQPIARHGHWSSYVIADNGQKTCYMASRPVKQGTLNHTKGRGEVYALITDRPAEGTKDVFSYIAGYVYKSGSEAILMIDGRNFKLFTKDDSAWARNKETDALIATAIRHGKNLTVKGVSAHGSTTLDIFSLSGAPEAYADLAHICFHQK